MAIFLISLAQPCLAGSMSLPAHAIVEVFTQETSTCDYQPQGDQEIKDILARYQDVLILTCHDSYLSAPPLSPEEKEAFGGYCKKRKVEYAGFVEIYTFNIPLVMVNGRYDLNASYPPQIPSGISMARSFNAPQTIPLEAADGLLHFTLEPAMAAEMGTAPLSVKVIAYRPETDSRPEELMGIVNPITNIRDLGYWDGKAQNFSVPISSLEQRGFAVILQKEPYAEILAAGRLEITP